MNFRILSEIVSNMDSYKNKSLNEILDSIEQQIRQGQIRQAQQWILELVVGSEVQRSDRLRLANLSRRAGLVVYSLKLLNKIINSDQYDLLMASPLEIISYSAGLSLMGATAEAEKRLNAIDTNTYPEALLHTAFLHISNWQYQKSIPYLKKYSKHPNVSPYQKIVAKVNLLACYLFVQKSKKFLKNSDRLLKLCIKNSYQLLAGNILEMQAQYYILSDQLSIADVVLQQAEKFINSEESSYSLLIEKWKFICKTKQFLKYKNAFTGNIALNEYADNKMELNKSFQLINDFELNDLRNQLCDQYQFLKNKSKRLNSHETARDLDLYFSLLQENKIGLNKVYWGTENQSYKDRVLLISSHFFKPDTNVSIPCEHEDLPKVIFDLNHFTINGQKTSIRPDSRTWVVIKYLSRDFYRPVRIGELFNFLYPKESFNIEISLEKIKKVIFRVRQDIIKHQLPLKIMIKNNSIYLIRNCDWKIFSNKKIIKTDLKLGFYLDSIKNKFGKKTVSYNQIKQLFLNISDRSLSRKLNEMIQLNWLITSGWGAGRTYQIL